jgi:hypothetical protein
MCCQLFAVAHAPPVLAPSHYRCKGSGDKGKVADTDRPRLVTIRARIACIAGRRVAVRRSDIILAANFLTTSAKNLTEL